MFRIGQAEIAAPEPRKLRPAPSKARLPSAATIAGWHSALTDGPDAEAARHYLSTVRGIGPEVWTQFRLGWDGSRITLPVYDAHDELVNVRRRSPRPGAKVIGLAGHGTRYLYPAPEHVPLDGRVFIVEGELDALLLWSLGFAAFTCPGGAAALPGVIAAYADAFDGLDVVVWTDADPAGEQARDGVVAALEDVGIEPTVVELGDVLKGFDVTDAWKRLGLGFTDWLHAQLSGRQDDAYERKVRERLTTLRVNEEAVARLRLERAREHGNAPPELADIPTGDQWLAVVDDEPRWRIDPLIEEGHSVLLGGKDKVGKTTLAVDLLVTLTGREPMWLNEFPVSPPAGRIGWINCEMTEAQFRRWCRSAGVVADRFSPLTLRGNVPNFLDLEWWSRIEAWLQREGVTFLIVDSLTEIVAAAGLDEDKEGVEVLTALNRYRQTTDLSELLVLAHFGHNGERVRGTSKFGGWVDTKLSYVMDADERRYLSATGRDTYLPEGEVMRNGAQRLVFQPGMSRAASKAERHREGVTRREQESAALREVVLQAVGADPGCSSTTIRKAVRGLWRQTHDSGPSSDRIDDARDALVEAGKLRLDARPRGGGTASRHYLVEEIE